MKLCLQCKTKKPLEDFSRDNKKKDKHCIWCKRCSGVYAKSYYKANIVKESFRSKKHYRNNLDYYLHRNAKRRAVKSKTKFDLQIKDINIPIKCPILDINLIIGQNIKHKYSPTLDRLDNNKGYTKENILVVSNFANTIKSNGTIEELSMLISFLEKIAKFKNTTWASLFKIMKLTEHKENKKLAKIMHKKRKEDNKARFHREFSLTVNDILVSDICPALLIPLFRGKGHSIDNSPSIDRIDNTKGYVSNNIAIISKKANMMKNNALINELKQICNGYKAYLENQGTIL